MISKTPKPPYYAAIFSSQRSPGDQGYESMAGKMFDLAGEQSGFLGVETVRDDKGFGITVSYWQSLEDIAAWKRNSEHLEAQSLGKEKWYDQYKIRICKVERDYGAGV